MNFIIILIFFFLRFPQCFTVQISMILFYIMCYWTDRIWHVQPCLNVSQCLFFLVIISGFLWQTYYRFWKWLQIILFKKFIFDFCPPLAHCALSIKMSKSIKMLVFAFSNVKCSHSIDLYTVSYLPLRLFYFWTFFLNFIYFNFHLDGNILSTKDVAKSKSGCPWTVLIKPNNAQSLLLITYLLFNNNNNWPFVQ